MTGPVDGSPDGAPASGRGLEVVVVAYGNPLLLDACLSALDGGYVPLVVDNSSDPTTRDIVVRHGGSYLDPGRNLGFAAGVNHALGHRLQPGSDVLLLNPDATISSEGIRTLHERLAGDPTLACVAPAQEDPRSGEAARVRWPIPSPAGVWLEAVGLGSLRRSRHFVIGAVLLLRAEAIDDVGWMDERFFLYSEEADWELRALDRGWGVAVYPDIVATHVGAGTGGDPTRRETHFHASHERFIRKHYGPVGWQIYRAGTVVGAALRAAAPNHDRAALARTRLGLYLSGPCRAESRLR